MLNSALHSIPKPKIIKRKLVVDFPDTTTKDIFGPKWHNCAYMLGIHYRDQAIGYGENQLQKIRYEISVQGPEEAVEEFLEFMDKSLELVDDVDLWPDVH